METNDIKKRIENENDVSYISTIEQNGRQYVKIIKKIDNGIEYLYYEIIEDEIIIVEDEQLLEYFKETYECQASNIIY